MDKGVGEPSRRSNASSPRGAKAPELEKQTQEHLYKILVIGDFGVGK